MKRKETLALERNLEEKIYTKVKKREKKVGRSNDSSNDSFYDVCSFKIRLKAKVLAEEGVSGGEKAHVYKRHRTTRIRGLKIWAVI